ncbi:MAG: glycosyltransferase family 4 protein [Dehalococcoidia bacterium]
MKILFVTPQRPEPPKKGTTLRNYALIRRAARRHQVRVLTVESAPPEPAGEFEPLGVPIDAVPAPGRPAGRRLADLATGRLPDLAVRLRSPEAHDRFVDLLRTFEPDVVQFEAVEAAGAVAPLGAAFRAAGVRPWIVYDAHNAEFALQETLWRGEALQPRRWPRALYSLIQGRRLRHWEAGLCRAATSTIAVSEGDATLLERLSGIQPVVIPNGVDTDYYRPTAGPILDPVSPLLLFIGTLDFRPNVDAAVWLVHEILPPLVREIPGARIAIAGRDPAPAVRALAGPNVDVIGPVDDERPLLAQASVCVVPLRSGGGMRFKVVQAMAAGLPVVSTTFGADGVAARHGEHLVLADTPEAFVAAIRRTIGDPAATRRRIERARTLAVQRYDWRAILPALDDLYDRLDVRSPAGAAR